MNSQFQNPYNNLAAAGSALGGLTGTSIAQPRTLSSAIGRLDSLNERLDSLRGMANSLADQIGGPRPIAKGVGASGTEAVGAVARLNDAADTAHSMVLEIEETLRSVIRALG